MPRLSSLFCKVFARVIGHDPRSSHRAEDDGGRSSAGRAPDCDSGCRGFEPRRPPHLDGSRFDRNSLVGMIFVLGR